MSASDALALYILSLSQVLKAPPEQVSISFLTGLFSLALRHWYMAECSESTGSSSRPSSAALSITSLPPVTSASLLAKSTLSHTSSAASTLLKPAMPTTAHSASWGLAAQSIFSLASGPKNHSMPFRSSGISVSFCRAQKRGRKRLASPNSFSADVAADSASARNISGYFDTISSVCVPMEPVAPNTAMFLIS